MFSFKKVLWASSYEIFSIFREFIKTIVQSFEMSTAINHDYFGFGEN